MLVFEGLNTLTDFILPVYVVLAILFIVRFRKSANAEVSQEPKVYKFVKKGARSSLTWKQKIAGTWEKTERKGFYEVNDLCFYFVFFVYVRANFHLDGLCSLCCLMVLRPLLHR